MCHSSNEYSFPYSRSKHEEIDLVSEEEFYQEAPPEISRPQLTKNDPHQLTLARLDWELEQRKRYFKKKNNNKQTTRRSEGFVPAQSVCSMLCLKINLLMDNRDTEHLLRVGMGIV